MMFRMTMLLLALATVGCRNRGSSTEPLEHENRLLNEYILQLEIELEQQKSALARARDAEKDDRDEDRRSPASSRPRSSDRPRGESPTGPDIDLGDPVDPSKRDLPSAPRFENHNDGSAARGMMFPTSTAPRVSYVTLNAQESTGYFRRSQGRDDLGINVVVEPRDASGSLVRGAGQIAIAAWDQVLLDRYRGDRQRQTMAQVGVWEFTTSEVQGKLDDSDDGRIRFRLPFLNKRPEHTELRLYVRYITLDGRELRAELPIEMEMPRLDHEGSRSSEPVPDEELLVPQVPATKREGRPVLNFPTEAEEVPAVEARKEANRRPSWSPYR